MARNRTHIPVAPSVVWARLADPYAYPRWVVGSDRTVSADEHWPLPEAEFRVRLVTGHVDHTIVREVDPGRSIKLEVGSMVGPASVLIELQASNGGTDVTLIENPAGKVRPLRYLPPVQLLIKLRNVESLRRLRRLCQAS